MERKEGVAVKMEDLLGNSSCSEYTVNNFPFQSIYDLCSSEKDQKIRSLGFMDLLGVQDLISTPPFLEIMAAQQDLINPCSKKIESPPEVFNQPATLNSSTISYASSEAIDYESAKADDQEQDQKKTKKQLKPKKTKQKRQKREPRFAFMTKSEVDHLEDGYRWRKYGQKAVKNSHFPRSYYRCTTASCNVKKRFERSFTDPSIVVTTYEGQHTHPSPMMPRPSLCGSLLNSAISTASFGLPMRSTPSHYQYHQQQQQHQQHQQPFMANSLSPLSFGHHGFCTTTRSGPEPGQSLLKDHGLLQDILPSHMLKEE